MPRFMQLSEGTGTLELAKLPMCQSNDDFVCQKGSFLRRPLCRLQRGVIVESVPNRTLRSFKLVRDGLAKNPPNSPTCKSLFFFTPLTGILPWPESLVFRQGPGPDLQVAELPSPSA